MCLWATVARLELHNRWEIIRSNENCIWLDRLIVSKQDVSPNFLRLGFFSTKFSQAAATSTAAALTLANLERLLMELKQNFTSVAPETFFSWKKLFLIFLHPSFFVFLISRVKKNILLNMKIFWAWQGYWMKFFLWRREICPIEKSPNLKNTSLT